MTATYVDDRADVLGRVDLAALFVDLGHPQGRNRQSLGFGNFPVAQKGRAPRPADRQGYQGHCHR